MSASYAVGEIRKHFFDAAPWVDPEDTCDLVCRGDSKKLVGRIGVGWSCCAPNLEAAAADGCELFISHEGLLHGDDWAADLNSEETPWGRRRLKALDDANMACMRLHDTWDNYPEHGIRDAWRRFLGLGDLVAERPYHYPWSDRFAPRNSLALSRVEPQTLGAFARHVARACDVFPCFQGVTVHGDTESEVKTVATGVGCHVPTLEMLELGADVLIVTFDRAWQETTRLPLTDMDARVLALEHGVSEMPGMRSMAALLEDVFPGVRAEFYCREPEAVTVTAGASGCDAAGTDTREPCD